MSLIPTPTSVPPTLTRLGVATLSYPRNLHRNPPRCTGLSTAQIGPIAWACSACRLEDRKLHT